LFVCSTFQKAKERIRPLGHQLPERYQSCPVLPSAVSLPLLMIIIITIIITIIIIIIIKTNKNKKKSVKMPRQWLRDLFTPNHLMQG